MKEITVSVLINKEEKVLLLKRLPDKEFDPEKWEFVSGFVRENKSLEENATEQLFYETAVKGKLIQTGKSFEVDDQYGKWLIHPFLFETDSIKVKVKDCDHSEYKWVAANTLQKFNCVKDLEKNLESLGILRKSDL
jgi:ADP-ribose pyrophosphatase YjhB (NUDIX family)